MVRAKRLYMTYAVFVRDHAGPINMFFLLHNGSILYPLNIRGTNTPVNNWLRATCEAGMIARAMFIPSP